MLRIFGMSKYDDFIFEITRDEVDFLMSQIVISKTDPNVS